VSRPPSGRAGLPGLVLLALLATGLAGCGDPPPPNLIVYLVDTLRADHLGCYGYPRDVSPAIDAFSRDATLFEEAIAQSSWTRSSVASLFTGLVPPEHGANRRRQPLAEEAVTLAELLRGAGYRTAAFVTNTNVSERFGFDQGFDELVYREAMSASKLMREVEAWLDARAADGDERPFFLYVHTLDPHSPYAPPARERERWAPDVPEPGPYRPNRWIDEARAGKVDLARLLRRMRALYDAEIAANDRAFGALLDGLRERGLYDGAVLALVSDHGEEFFEHRSFEHGKGLFEEVLRVPMLVRWGSGGPTGRVPIPVQHVDLFQTLLEAAGVEAPRGTEGVSLLRLARAAGRPGAAGERPIFSYLHLDGRPRAALREGRSKLIVALDGERLIRPRLYDLEADPGEAKNLAKRDPERVARMEAVIRGYLAKERHGLRGAPVEMDDELRRRLEALGYM
jgi:choline-sulfatase